MDYLSLAALVVGGFTACAEFGSYAFVHPVLRRLPPEQHIDVEQGLLRTFGRAMPVLMPATLILALIVAIAGDAASEAGPALWRWLAVGAYAAAVISTVLFNVPVNIATGRWDRTRPPEDWTRTRNRWELFQGVRSWLLVIGFVLTCVGVTAG